MYRCSDGLSMRPDDPNTLTCQYAYINDTPKDPIYGPDTWNLVRTCPKYMLRLLICYRQLCHLHNHFKHWHCIKSPKRYALFIWHEFRHWHWIFCIDPRPRFLLVSDSPITFDSNLLIQFDSYFLIWLNSHCMKISFDLIQGWVATLGVTHRP